MPPGCCVFTEDWSPAPLLERSWIGHDTLLLTFGLQDAGRPLGLSTCACLLARAGSGEGVVRPYTPVSTNAMLGAFQLMVKVYPGGAMSEQLAQLPIGASIDFKHIPFNARHKSLKPEPSSRAFNSMLAFAPRVLQVKIQYPFGARDIVMLVGGTGIAPMLQALHALLGTPSDHSRTTVLYSSKSQADILARDTLDAWAAQHPHRLRVHHTLTREPEGTGWTGRRGRIDAALLSEHLPPPSEDVLIFVCGPPQMYDTLCGPRTDEQLSGLLAQMGYRADQICKF